MTLTIDIEPLPLLVDDDGVVRVGGTRVTLDTIVTAFNEGANAEEIVQQYPSLSLADVYAVIGYYLRRRSEIDDYLEQRTIRAEEYANPTSLVTANVISASVCWRVLLSRVDHASLSRR
jgi:uncharacterized protein (DUF433 family)